MTSLPEPLTHMKPNEQRHVREAEGAPREGGWSEDTEHCQVGRAALGGRGAALAWLRVLKDQGSYSNRA